MIVDVADWLAARGCGTVNADLFLGTLPAVPAVAAALQERPGLPPLDDFGATALEQPRWLVLVRDPSYAAARQRAERFYRALLTITNLPIGTAVYTTVRVYPPEQLDIDTLGRHVLGVAVEAQKTLEVL